MKCKKELEKTVKSEIKVATIRSSSKTKFKMSKKNIINDEMAYSKTKKKKNNSLSENEDGMDADSSDKEENLKSVLTNTQKEIVNAAQNSGKVQTEIFKHTDKGPYNIIIEKTNIQIYEVAIKINKLKLKNLIDITKISRNKVRVSFKDFSNANKLLRQSSLADFEEFKIYIPESFVTIYGIIRNIPIYIKEEEINKNLSSTIPIVGLERLNWWDRVNNMAKPSETIKIKFRSHTIPNDVMLYGVHNRVQLFIPRPTICFKCLNFGHIQKFCKNDLSLCKICTKPIHDDAINCEIKCNHCKDKESVPHKTADKECPEFLFQVEIKKVMILKQLSFNEAKNSIIKKNTGTLSNEKFINHTGPSYSQITKMQNSIHESFLKQNYIDKDAPTTSKSAILNDSKDLLISQITKSLESLNKAGAPSNDLILMKIGEAVHNFKTINNVK